MGWPASTTTWCAVRWLVRDESDAERRTFYDPSDEDEENAGSVIAVNSAELRHAGFELGLTGGYGVITLARNRRSGRDQAGPVTRKQSTGYTALKTGPVASCQSMWSN